MGLVNAYARSPPGPPQDPAQGFVCPRCQLGRMRPVASLSLLAHSLVAFFVALATLLQHGFDTS